MAAIIASSGLKSIEAADGSKTRQATLENKSSLVTVGPLAIWLSDFGSRKKEFEGIYSVFWIEKF